jgi:D-3-phosphoglycerate dehydrogenase
MKVIAWNRSGIAKDVPAESVALDDLLAASDAVSLHLALTPETRGFLDATRLAKLKPGAILVNTARAALVDTGALLDVLKRGRLRHAAIDVFDTEPMPASHPLTKLDNVTLTAHAGWKARAASARLLKIVLDMAAADAAALKAGQPLKL